MTVQGSCWRRVALALAVVCLGCLGMAVSAQAASRLYWGNENNGTISFANLDGSGGGGTLSTAGATPAPVGPAGTAIDIATGKIYFADPNTGTNKIYWANLDGSGGGVLNTAGATVDSPTGVAIDPAMGRLYWANDGGSSPISFAALDGSGGGNLNVTGATSSTASGLAIDPGTGRVYWASGGTISYANLDGSGGGGDLNISGATVDTAYSVAIDPTAGKIYWANETDNTIAFADLDGSHGGQLDTTGAALNEPFGLAIDPAAGKLYVANLMGWTLSVVNLTGGGAAFNTTPVSPEYPSFPSILEAPVGAGAPTVTQTSAAPGATLDCSEGSWGKDLLGASLYRSPRSFTYSWDMNGAPIPGATSHTITAHTIGSYVCHVTAANEAGSTVQSSAPATVALPPTAKVVSPAAGGTYELGESVPASFSCTEGTGGPGLGSCDDSAQTSTVSGGVGHLDTAVPGTHAYTVTATSQDGLTGKTSISYTVVAPPSATIVAPAAGRTYEVGEAVKTSFSCTEGAGGSGLSACTDSNGTSGGHGRLYTSTTGTHTYTVTATSTDGFTGRTSISYTVVPAAPLTVAITTARALVSYHRAKLRITCTGGMAAAECYTRLSLRIRKRVVRDIHHHRRVTFRTLVLARGSYLLASGSSRRVALRLTTAGIRLLAHAPYHHRLRVKATLTVRGGHHARRTITLKLKSPPKRHKRPARRE